jgi:hypothetical protein
VVPVTVEDLLSLGGVHVSRIGAIRSPLKVARAPFPRMGEEYPGGARRRCSRTPGGFVRP